MTDAIATQDKTEELSALEFNRTESPIGKESQDIAERIAAERQRLSDEQSIERTLTTERKRVLTTGTDAEASSVESRIDASRSSQARIEERIGLLQYELSQANERARQESLDAIADRANKARAYGETLIKQYGELASQIAPLLKKLAATDTLIDQSNQILEPAGRAEVLSSNSVRERPFQQIPKTKTIKIGHNDPRHPAYGYATSTTSYDRSNGAQHIQWFDSRTRQPIELISVDEQLMELDHGANRERLTVSVVLPGVNPGELFSDDQPLWNKYTATVTESNIAALIDELDQPRKPKSK